MLTSIKINGFKSFYNFEMSFTPFTVISGANASGKSNLFDALRLLSRLAETDNLKKAFKEQRGEYKELFTQYASDQYVDQMEFEVEMLVNKKVKDAWGNQEELKYTRLKYALTIKRFVNDLGLEDLAVVYESLENKKHNEDTWIKIIDASYRDQWRPKVSKGRRLVPYINTVQDPQGITTVEIHQDGNKGSKRRIPLNQASRTVLSSFDSIDFPHVLAAKEEMKSWKFLELNPEDLRQPSNKNLAEDELSRSGKNLAAVLYRIKQEDDYHLRAILRSLQKFLPNFTALDVIDDQENKQYIIKLTDKDQKQYSSRVLSEGTLRILALCILQYDQKYTGLLCFEEPENGVHPLRIKDMVMLLKGLSTDFQDALMPLRQVIVNTHSPVLVSAMSDWKKDPKVRLYYADLRNTITDIAGQRAQIAKTGISEVVLDESIPKFNTEDRYQKLTSAKIQEYLRTVSSNL